MEYYKPSSCIGRAFFRPLEDKEVGGEEAQVVKPVYVGETAPLEKPKKTKK